MVVSDPQKTRSILVAILYAAIRDATISAAAASERPMSQKLACVLALSAGALAQAGVTITSISREIRGTACVNAPPNAINWCQSDSKTKSLVELWNASISFGPGAAGEIGAATGVAQVAQESDATPESLFAVMSMYSLVQASGTCSASSSVTNDYEVVFHLDRDADMLLDVDATNDGIAFRASVSPLVGSDIYSTQIDDTETLALTAGVWKLNISGGRSLACAQCFSSVSSNMTVTATFDFGPCLADFNADNFVDDNDFVIFAAAYNELICPQFPTPCTGDINQDGYVDDSDFVLFAAAYNDLICP